MRALLLIAAVFLLADGLAAAQDAPHAMAIIHTRAREYYRVHGTLPHDLTLDQLVEPELLDDQRWDRTNFGFFVKSEHTCCIYYYWLREGDFPNNVGWEIDFADQKRTWLQPAPPRLPGFGTWRDTPELAATRERRRAVSRLRHFEEHGGEYALQGFPVLMMLAASACVLLGRRRRERALAAIVFACVGLLAGLLFFPRPWNADVLHVAREINFAGFLVMVANLALALAASWTWMNLRYPFKRRKPRGTPELPFTHIARLPGRRL
ncbi:MAG: hypothetical protein IT462_17830 [Planctomycetes bacterium]|nr:hypothetical protein [Planctomycetota bacterium]